MAVVSSSFQHIIQNAISSAICIDDRYVTPYQDPIGEDKLEDSKQLYESFRREGNCDLDIYKYESFEKFENDKKYLFENKDLLVLDWELNESDAACKYKDTLPILKQAIDTEFIQFVSIYTQEENTEAIALNIFSYFNYNANKKDEIYKAISEIPFIEANFEDEEKIETIIRDGVNGYVLNPTKRKELVTHLVTKIKRELENDGAKYGLFCKEIKKACESVSFNGKDLFEWLECYYSESSMSPSSDNYNVEIIPTNGIPFKTLLVGCTLVTIISKSKEGEDGRQLIKPKDLYSTISSTIENIPNKFSTLISLELKHFYKKNISAFGRGFMGIDENVLLYHAKNYEQDTQYEEFYNFILSCWNSQIVYRIKEEIQTPNLFSSTIQEHKIIPTPKQIANLNGFLTFSPNNKTVPKRKVRFGDVFLLEKAVPFLFEKDGCEIIDKENYKYLICLTQQCDCLRPHKINRHFVFSAGKIVKPEEIKTAVVKAETNQYTFINDEVIIEWDKKFFTINLGGNNEFKPKNGINFIFQRSQNKVKGEFLGNQKGTFTQRLANLVFSHAMRIGIDLPHL